MSNPVRRAFASPFYLLTICGLLFACAPAPTITPTPTRTNRAHEEQAVYAAAFEEVYGEPRMYVLMAQTSPGMEGVEGMESALASLLTRLPALEADTAADFRLRNQTAPLLPADMDLGLPYILLSEADFAGIFAPNTSGWDLFYTRYPNSPGVTTVSGVGFNPAYTQALVYIGTISHWLVGAGYYLLLEKAGDAWRVVEQVTAWIS